MSGKAFGWLTVAAATSALLTPWQGEAQAQTPAASNASDEIVVTATRRQARLQDVPIAVTPVTSELIENSGIRDVQDLTSVAPALQFNVSENETSATARLRGVGTQGSNPGLESAVGIFIDGVYRARNGVALSDLGEISQVEVLRGPQGTLFGRNTSAGLISINTKGPSLSGVEADVEATYGDYNETRLAASVSAPLVEDVLGVRLFGALAQRDGFMEVYDANLRSTDVNDRDVWTVRGQALWEPTADLSIRLIADYSERDEFCCAAQVIDPTKVGGFAYTNHPGASPLTIPFATGRTQLIAALGGYGPSLITPNDNSTPAAELPSSAAVAAALRGGDIDERIGFANRTYDQRLEDRGVSGEVNWDIGDLTLTSITAFRQWDFEQGQDVDFSAADIVYRPGDGSNGFGIDVFTQEFRLAGQAGPLDWLVGAFYADEEIERNDAFLTGSQYSAYFTRLDSVLAGLPVGTPLNAQTGLVAGLYDALAVLPSTAGSRDRYEQTSESIALFTHNIWAINDKTDLTLGLRFTSEEKEVSATYRTIFDAQPLFTNTVVGGLGPSAASLATCDTSVQPTGPLATATVIQALALLRSAYCVPWLRGTTGLATKQDRSEEEWSGVVSLRREFTENVSAYASFSRGYKGGGFNLDRDYDGNTAFDAELVDAYEIGAKSNWLNGDLLLNAALFYNEYQDFQLNTFTGIAFVVTSVPEVISQGVELDAIWTTPIEGLRYQGGVSYTEAEYGEDRRVVAANRNPITGEATLTNLPGSRLTNSPLWTTTHSFTYERPMFNEQAVGLVYVDARYTSTQNTGSDLRISKLQDDYVLVNARLGLSTADEKYGIELWARNVFDQEYTQIIFDTPLQAGTQGGSQSAFLGDPRTFGVTLRARY